MGIINHNAIVVTGWSPYDKPEEFQQLRNSIADIGLPTSAVLPAPINGYMSFFIAPDGSKEGWSESSEGDRKREEIRALLRAAKYTDWVEISYGEYGLDIPDSYRGPMMVSEK